MTNKPGKKQRNNNYIAAATHFCNREGLCIRLGNNNSRYTSVENHPELALFRPDNVYGGYWYKAYTRDLARELALAFMIAMTE